MEKAATTGAINSRKYFCMGRRSRLLVNAELLLLYFIFTNSRN
jgi:hypothetical protein